MEPRAKAVLVPGLQRRSRRGNCPGLDPFGKAVEGEAIERLSAAASPHLSARQRVSVFRIINLTRETQLAAGVELAGTGTSRRKGLLGRECLSPGEGLWIVPCEAVHTFWMRFPIDLIYLDRQHRVVKTRSNVGPWRMSACLRALSVVELAAGVIRETQTRRGDRLRLDAGDDTQRQNGTG